MEARYIIGIDAGVNGGIAIWDCENEIARVVKMPRDVTDLREMLEHYNGIDKTVVFLEKLSVRPDDTVAEGGRVNMGKLFRIQKMISGYEQLKATIGISGVPYVLVHPMTWQSRLGIRIKGEEKKTRKHRYEQLAEQYYGNIKVTLWNCDALLIMRFGVQAMHTDQKWVKANLPEREQSKLF